MTPDEGKVILLPIELAEISSALSWTPWKQLTQTYVFGVYLFTLIEKLMEPLTSLHVLLL